jgi:hypothetical protein
MAHFAEVIDGTVVRVLVVSNDITTTDGTEEEQRGIDYLDRLFLDSGTWVQCSYNATIRFNYPGPGYSWDRTGFAEPQPYPSWTLDENYVWQPPTPMPDDGEFHEWDEDTTSWVEITE